MYPRVGALPIAAVNEAIGFGGAAGASPRPPRPRPPRPAGAAPAPTTSARAGSFGSSPRPRPPRSAGGGVVGFMAATSELRSSSVDQRRRLILTGMPASLPVADFAVKLTAPG